MSEDKSAEVITKLAQALSHCKREVYATMLDFEKKIIDDAMEAAHNWANDAEVERRFNVLAEGGNNGND